MRLDRIDLFYAEDNKYTHTARLENCTAKLITTSSHSVIVTNNEKDIPKSVLNEKEMDEWCRIELKKGNMAISFGYDKKGFYKKNDDGDVEYIPDED